MSNSTETNVGAAHRAQTMFLWGLVVWILLQMSRFIAFALIDEINAGSESAAWMFPAYLDLFAAFLALPLIIAIWIRPGLFTWSLVLVYLSVSVIDHIGNFVTTDLVGPPSIVPEGSHPILFPLIMILVDAVFLVLLFIPKYRRAFFYLK